MMNEALANKSANQQIDSDNRLLDLIPNQGNLNILELGCGYGELTSEIAQMGNNVLGIDNSYEVISKAKRKHPDLNFKLMDAMDLLPNRKWDVIFSSMLFHTIGNHDILLNKISKALKHSGVLVCEFSVRGNSDAIENAVSEVLCAKGCEFKSPFNITTQEEFEFNLLKNGFNIDVSYTFEQRIPISTEKNGMREWILNLYDKDIAQYSLSERVEILKAIEDKLRDNFWNGHEWVAYFNRLNVVAYTL